MPSEREQADDPLRFFASEVGGDGTFSFINLPPGQYLTTAQAAGDKDPKTTEKLRLPDASEARSRIRRMAEAKKANIELKPCQNLTDFHLLFTNQ